MLAQRRYAVLAGGGGGSGGGCIFDASRLGCLSRVRSLLDSGSGTEARDATGRTPLIAAAEAGHTDIVTELLTHGADTEATDDSGSTALDVAALEGYEDTLFVLLEHGASASAIENAVHGVFLRLGPGDAPNFGDSLWPGAIALGAFFRYAASQKDCAGVHQLQQGALH